MDFYGYAGNVLYVDLTTGQVTRKDLDAETARKFIGGFGVSLRLAYDLIKPKIDPLSPHNVIIIGAGPLVGTQSPGAIKCTIVTKYPLTNNIAMGSGSMAFGRRLKFAGYDNVVITGRADKPVYVKIFNNNIEICDARHLWGKDTFETANELWRELGKNYSLITMGQAGENLVRSSVAMIDKIATIGKGGLPAVMGSKNLKAIAVGGNKGVEVFASETFKKLIAPLSKLDREEEKSEGWRKIGKASGFALAAKVGIPYKNYTEIYPPEDAIKKYGIEEILKVQGKRVGCPGCPRPCKDILETKEGEYVGLTTHVSSFIGRLSNFGCQCGADTIEQVVKLTDLSARYGIDSHIFAPTMELAIDLYERGIINKEDTEGLVLKQDFETTLKLLEMVAFKQGIGNVLGDGSLGIINKYGNECEKYSMHIKGMDAQRDGRLWGFDLTEFGLLINPRGGADSTVHLKSRSRDSLEDSCSKIRVPDEAKDRIIFKSGGYNSGILSRYAQDFNALLDCLGICSYKVALYDVNKLSEIYSAVTGIEMDPTAIIEGGERVYNLYRAINIREGRSRNDDRIPPKWFEPIKTTNGKDIRMRSTQGDILSAADVEKLLVDYYEERGWDVETGVPFKQKLMDLGLTNVVEDFLRLGILK